MQLKLKLLIPGAIFTLLALTSIQGYLIYNSYELQRKTFLTDARSAIASVYNTPQVDSLMWVFRNDFLTHLDPYVYGELSKTDLVDSLKSKTASINPTFNNYFKEGLAKKELGLHVNLKVIPAQILLLDTLGKADTIHATEKQGELLLLGTPFETESGILINNSSWRQDLPYGNNDEAGNINLLEFRSQIYMSIDNWESAMFQSLLGLFIAVFFLLVFVVTLLFYSIRNLIKQKKLADIKTDFINNITHELKTPLSTLAVATKTLAMQNGSSSKEQTDKTVAVIDRQNVRLHKLIDQVVNNSVGYQDLELSKESLVAGDFLHNLLNDYALTLKEEVTLTQANDLNGAVIIADKFYLGTAIINILNNAVKYGGTQIIVSAQETQKFMRISISDNGIGIASKNHNQIFDKFFRVSQQNKHDYKGLGLGLFYCNQVIQAHYGKIEIESALGQGSTFHLFIPLKQSNV